MPLRLAKGCVSLLASKVLPGRHPRRGVLTSAGLQAACVLESRELPSATGVAFDSALAVGNDDVGSKMMELSLDVDSAGNRYVAGSFQGMIDFDPGASRADNSDILTARGFQDGFVAKYAPDNTLVWAVSFGGTSQDAESCQRIKVDGSGSVLVTGEFAGTAVFGSKSLVSAGARDVFVGKLDTSGVVQWVQRSGAAANDHAAGIDFDAAGNIYSMATRFSDGIEVRKYSATGKLAWSKAIDTNTNYGVWGGLAVDPVGNLYLADNFMYTVDFDPGLKTSWQSSIGSSTSGFVMSLDTKGNFRWVSPIMAQTGGSAQVTSLAWDSNGYVVAAGHYQGTVDMDPGASTLLRTSSSGLSGFVSKFQATSGGLVWNDDFQAATMTDVDVDAAGGVYATGWFQNSVDVDPGTGEQLVTSNGGNDAFVLKLNSNGTLAWGVTFGGAGADIGRAIAVGPAGTVHLAGYFSDTVDFDPDPVSAYEFTAPTGKTKAYLLRLLQV